MTARGALAACLAAAALFGAAAPAAKVLLGGLGPITTAGLLYLGAGLAAMPFAAFGGSRGWVDPRQRIRLAGAVVAGGLVGPVLLMLGLRTAPAASAALWLALELPATAVMAWLWFGEHMEGRTAAAAGLAILAGLLLASPGGFALAWGGLLVAGAAVAWGVDNNLTALVPGYTPAHYTALKGLTAGAVNLALGLGIEGPPGAPRLVVLALATGAVGYGGSLLFYVGAAQRLGAVRAQTLFATSPLFGVALAHAWLGERVGALHLVAALLLGGAAAFLTGERHTHRHRHGRLVHSHPHRHDARHRHAH